MEKGRYIRSIQLKHEKLNRNLDFPFSINAIAKLTKLDFQKQVVFIIGENGTGKSTLLEAIAVSYGFNPEGGTRNFNFRTKETHSVLHNFIRVEKGIERPKDGFFFRAESFYNVATEIDNLGEEDNRIKYIDQYGGKSLHEMSHGESFLSLFLNKFSGNGIYILDEPEAALSPKRQLTLLIRMHELVENGSQFIISTHSPILLAYPGSDILDVEKGYKKLEYTETDQYQIMKGFITCPERYLHRLFSDEE